MIIAITNFALAQPITPTQARELFLGSAPNYRNVPGLLAKHYILADDGRSVGGIYHWATRHDAETAYDEAWRAAVRARYDTEPCVVYFDNPVSVDNLTGRILSDPVA